MKCAIRFCPWSASDRGLCTPHAHWVRVILADPRYRTERPPAAPFAEAT